MKPKAPVLLEKKDEPVPHATAPEKPKTSPAHIYAAAPNKNTASEGISSAYLVTVPSKKPSGIYPLLSAMLHAAEIAKSFKVGRLKIGGIQSKVYDTAAGYWCWNRSLQHPAGNENLHFLLHPCNYRT